MRKTVALIVSALALVLVFAGSAFAQVTSGDTYGPAARSGPDNGSCSNTWAQDAWKRTFVVDPNPTVVGGSYVYDFTRYDRRGTFVTIAGTSPGACDNAAPPTGNGNTVNAGIKGHFHGYVNYSVTCASPCYSPASAQAYMDQCSTDNSCTTEGFGPAAFPSGTVGSGTFKYVYTSKNSTLCARRWVDQGNDGIAETFTGDIANVCH